MSANRDLLLTDTYGADVSPGAGYLSQSDDDELQPMENTIQLAWQPSFAEEYKRLLGTGTAEEALAESAKQGAHHSCCLLYMLCPLQF